MSRVTALDGLRGYAFLAVFWFHTYLPGTEGGYLGVNVFFVLSGYLITTILLREHAAGGIRFRRFYARRIARLYPALLLTVALVAALAAVNPAKPFGLLHAVVALTYTTNLYAPRFGDLGALNHTWTLAVEEQFYLLWPLVLGLAVAVRRRVRLPVLLVAGAVMAAATGWELIAGCALAMLLRARTPAGRLTGFAGGAGAALLIVAVVVADGAAWHSWLAGLGSLSLILALANGSVIGRLFEATALRWLGRISYGAYLYHYPLLVFVWPSVPGPRPLAAVVVLAATVALAAASFRFVEEPVRRRASGRATATPLPTPGAAVLPVSPDPAAARA